MGSTSLTPPDMPLCSLTAGHLAAYLTPYRQAKRWLVSYSGGVDSHVLLHLLAQLCSQTCSADDPFPSLEAIHINHQLQSQSQQWADHCQRQAAMLGIAVTVLHVDVDQGGNLEERARQARYRALESVSRAGDVIFMGHHLDDQAETVLLRLFRGSGSRGMSGMPHKRPLGRAQLLRPLLDITRSDIEHYARRHKLCWVEDPSNRRADFDRNFLRTTILPMIAQRWPQYRQTVARAARLSEESTALNSELAQWDCHALGLDPDSGSLPINVLADLSAARTKNLLRYWLLNRGLALPTAGQLQAVLDQLITAKQDAQPLVQWSMGEHALLGERSCVQVRRFRGQLYAMAKLPAFDPQAQFCWDLSQPLVMLGVGQLSAKRVLGNGLKAQGPLQVRFRRGGERCKPRGRHRSQTLKKLFQEYDIPPWLRERVPLIYRHDELVAVGDYWVCEGYSAEADEAGLLLHWQQP